MGEAAQTGQANRRQDGLGGNPFLLGKHGDRDGIIAAYREHLDHSPGLKANLGKLRGKVLLCLCHPEPCHGDVLCEAVENAFPTSSPA